MNMGMDNHNDDQEAYLQRCVDIEPLALEEEYVRVSADLAYWSAQHADAVKAYLHGERLRKHTFARLFLITRERNEKANLDTIKSMVEVDLDFQAAYVAEVEAEARKEFLRGQVDAIRTKRDMLVELGATRRKEMANDPLIRQHHAGARMQREGG